MFELDFFLFVKHLKERKKMSRPKLGWTSVISKNLYILPILHVNSDLVRKGKMCPTPFATLSRKKNWLTALSLPTMLLKWFWPTWCVSTFSSIYLHTPPQPLGGWHHMWTAPNNPESYKWCSSFRVYMSWPPVFMILNSLNYIKLSPLMYAKRYSPLCMLTSSSWGGGLQAFY